MHLYACVWSKIWNCSVPCSYQISRTQAHEQKAKLYKLKKNGLSSLWRADSSFICPYILLFYRMPCTVLGVCTTVFLLCSCINGRKLTMYSVSAQCINILTSLDFTCNNKFIVLNKWLCFQIGGFANCPCGVFKFPLIFFFTMPDFWALQQYKMAHVFCSNLEEHYGKAFMGKSCFDKATRENNGNMPDWNPWF